MSALPKQVAQQQKELEELEKQVYGNQEPEPQPSEPKAQEPEPAPQPQTQQVEPSPTNVVELKQPEDPKWEERYKALKGMFDAEMPKLQHQNKELLTQLQAMQQQIDALKQQPAPKQEEDDRLITDKDREVFGDDLADFVNRAALQVAKERDKVWHGEIAKRDEKIAQLETLLNRTSGDVTTMTFEQRLERAVPDFNAVNTNPKFMEWLNQIDPFTGEPRKSYAEYVYGQGNVEKLKAIIDLFKQQSAPAQQDLLPRQKELERQVQPTRTSANVVPQGEKIYTESEMGRLFDKVRTLNINGKYEEASKLEAELTAAYQQGRVRG